MASMKEKGGGEFPLPTTKSVHRKNHLCRGRLMFPDAGNGKVSQNFLLRLITLTRYSDGRDRWNGCPTILAELLGPHIDRSFYCFSNRCSH